MKHKTKIKFTFSIIWSEFMFMIENMRYGKWVHFPVSPRRKNDKVETNGIGWVLGALNGWKDKQIMSLP